MAVNRMTDRQRFALLKWIEQHAPALSANRHATPEIAKMAAEALGYPITHANVAHAFGTLGLDLPNARRAAAQPAPELVARLDALEARVAELAASLAACQSERRGAYRQLTLPETAAQEAPPQPSMEASAAGNDAGIPPLDKASPAAGNGQQQAQPKPGTPTAAEWEYAARIDRAQNPRAIQEIQKEAAKNELLARDMDAWRRVQAKATSRIVALRHAAAQR